jgi:hypothetical protein
LFDFIQRKLLDVNQQFGLRLQIRVELKSSLMIKSISVLEWKAGKR